MSLLSDSKCRLDYWLVPQVNTFYFSRYEMDATKAAFVLRLVRHVLLQKGLGHLLLDGVEDEL